MSSSVLAHFFFGLDLSRRYENTPNYELIEKLHKKLNLDNYDSDEWEEFLAKFGFEVIYFGYDVWESKALAIIDTHRRVDTGCLELENFECNDMDHTKYNIMFDKLLTELEIFGIKYSLNWHLASFLG